MKRIAISMNTYVISFYSLGTLRHFVVVFLVFLWRLNIDIQCLHQYEFLPFPPAMSKSSSFSTSYPVFVAICFLMMPILSGVNWNLTVFFNLHFLDGWLIWENAGTLQDKGINKTAKKLPYSTQNCPKRWQIGLHQVN